MIVIIIALSLMLLLCYLGLRGLYDKFWDRGLSCRISFTQEYAEEDQISVLSEVIENRKFLPLPVLEISFHMDRRLRFGGGENASLSDQTYRRDVFAAGPRQRITRRLEFKCAGRGYFRINQCGLTAKDLFLSRKYVDSRPQHTEFYVLPKSIPLSRLQIPYSKIMGAVLSRKRVCDDPFEFAGLREYSRGDPMKYINWKATARAGQLLINLHESTLSQRVIIALDMEAGGSQGDFLNEAGIRVACTLAGSLLASGVEVGLYSNGLDVQSGERWSLPSVAGGGSMLALKKKLACLSSDSGLPGVCQCLPKLAGTDHLVVLISRSQREDLGRAFSAAVGRGRGLRIIPCGLGTSAQAAEELVGFSNIEPVWLEF